jgi:predicted double-glycine peptidase
MQKWDNSCGAAAVATVLTYYHRHPVSEERVARGMLKTVDPTQVRQRGGFSLLNMKRYLNEKGFSARALSGLTIDDLASQPYAIVPVKAWGYNHFVVIRKVSDGKVDVADPGFGNYTISREKFKAVWEGQIAFFIEKAI